jgi:uncharacterized protein YjbI with pentapeptide repeats
VPDPTSVRIDHQQVTGADYSGQVLDEFMAHGSTFTACRFDKVKVKHAAFGVGQEVSRYVGCSFNGATLTSLGGFVRFEKCAFHNLKVTRSRPDYLEFVDCTFTGRVTGLRLWASAPGADALYAQRQASPAGRGRPERAGYRELALRGHNEIRGNDFSAARLIDVEFRFGVDLTEQKLPAGDEYLYLPDAETTLLSALAALAPDPSEEARQAKTFLQSRLEHTVASGQRQLLINERDHEHRGVLPPYVAMALAALRNL